MTRELDHELRRRLARLDPVPADQPVDRVTGPRARQLLELTMQTTDSTVQPLTSRRMPLTRRTALLALAAAATGVLAVGTAVLVRGGSGSAPGPAPSAAKTLALSVPGGVSMVSCLPFDEKFLREMPLAFAGTVTSATRGRVTLAVDRWYKGGDAGAVTVSTPDSGSPVSIGTVTFEQGSRYLLTATDGTVNGCGYSGLATPELKRSFDDAFGG